jgi:predicted AAA+ superfamily ATPase
MPKNDYLRWRIENVRDALKVRRVVVISGARQTGKTTLAKQVLDVKKNPFRPLDMQQYLEAAKLDPSAFVHNTSGTMLIDEIQKAPELISEIKYIVDNDNRNGQYLLTGSANIQSLPSVSESLAGRVRNIRLRPLTQGEILGHTPKFLERAFGGGFPARMDGWNKEAIFDLAFRGGYPEAVRLKTQKERKDWSKDYINAIIENDMRDIANITRQDALRDLIEIMAAWSGKFMDATAIGTQTGLSRPTVTSYINTLEALYLFERVRPWIKTDYDRVGRSYKTYATDTGFMASVLDWKQKDVLEDLAIANTDRAGKLIETFVFQELAAQIDLSSEYSLYQYRDREKHEVDFIIQRSDGAIIGVEVKTSGSASSGDFAPQKWFRNTIIKNSAPFRGIVLYTGKDTLSFGDGMTAVPIASLWEK